MELDTAARDTLPVVCIVSLKGGRTASPQGSNRVRNLQNSALFLPEQPVESRSLAARTR
jgi:hypothetical protein